MYEEKIYDFNKQSRYLVINLLLLRMIHKLWLACFLPEIYFYLILSESETTTSVSLNFTISLGNKINICFYIPTRVINFNGYFYCHVTLCISISFLIKPVVKVADSYLHQIRKKMECQFYFFVKSSFDENDSWNLSASPNCLM